MSGKSDEKEGGYFRAVHGEGLSAQINAGGKKYHSPRLRTVLEARRMEMFLNDRVFAEANAVRAVAQALLKSMGEYPDGGKYWDVELEYALQNLVLRCQTCGEFEYYWKHLDQYKHLGIWHEFKLR